MKVTPSFCVLGGVALAGALLIGCEGGISQLDPAASDENVLVSAYVDPINPIPGYNPRAGGDGDQLPVPDGDAQDKEWSVAKPLYVYVSADRGMGGRGFYIELRSVWSDESRFIGGQNFLYLLARWADDTQDNLPDYWRYAHTGQLGLIPSPEWVLHADRECDSVAIQGANWISENRDGAEDQVAFLFDSSPVGSTPASDAQGNYADIGCQIACHGGDFGTVGAGKLDLWVWRAGRTNALKQTAYPDLNQTDDMDGTLVSSFPRIDTDAFWPSWMEDMSISPAGLQHDAPDPNWPFTAQGYTGQLYTLNMTTDPNRTADGQPIPSHITEKVIIRRESTAPGEQEEDKPPNGGLPSKLYLWGPTAKAFSACDSAAVTRPIGNRYPNWSQSLNPGDLDVMPGYRLWVPSGSAADVRAKGIYKTNTAKRFSTWAVEIRRPMITGFDDDVRIEPDKEYLFTVAIFDRSSQIHSGSGPLRLSFQQSRYAKPAPPPGSSR